MLHQVIYLTGKKNKNKLVKRTRGLKQNPKDITNHYNLKKIKKTDKGPKAVKKFNT